jgi:hypothetical protein
VERVASASVPDVTQTNSTDTTMPVALARRAEDDTRTQVREIRAHCDALQPAHLTAHKSLHHISAVCYRLQHSTRPGLCLIRPGWRPASPEGQPLRQVYNQRSKHQTTTDDGSHAKSVQTGHPNPAKIHATSSTHPGLESDQHNKREASPVGPSHRNSRPQGASAKPIPILPPSQSSVLAQTSLLPDPLLPFTPPEDQLIWDSRAIDYFNQFHSLSTTPLCPTLQLTRCSAPPQYLLNAQHPLPPTSPEDQLVSDLHTIGYLISPTPIHVHPNQSNPTHLQYSLLPGSPPDHPDEAKKRTIVKILTREKPAYSPFYPPAEEHERRPAASFLNHQDPATTADAKTPQDRGAHRISRPSILRTTYKSSVRPHSTPHWATPERT